MSHSESAPPELDLSAADDVEITRPPKSPWREALSSLLRKPSAIVGLIILGILALIAIFAPVIATHDPLAVLEDIPEEGTVRRMDPCIHLLGCPSRGGTMVKVVTDDPITIAALNTENSFMFAASGNTITVWNAKTGKEFARFEHDEEVQTAAWSSNDQEILSVSGEELVIWDFNKRERMELDETLIHEGGALQVEWRGQEYFLSANHTNLDVWTVAADQYRKTIVPKQVDSLTFDDGLITAAWNDNGTEVMTASGNKVEIWYVTSYSYLGQQTEYLDLVAPPLEHEGPITDAVYNKDRSRILVISDNKLYWWKISTDENTGLVAYAQEELFIEPPAEYEAPLTHAAWGENVARSIRYVMATSGDTGLIWDTATGELVLELQHGAPVEKISSSPLATLIFTQSKNNIRVWDMDSGDEIMTIERDKPITQAVWQRTGGGILIASGNELSIVKTSNYQYLMGVDGNGRDMFSRVLYGTRISLMVGLTTVGLAVVTGTLAGSIAGYAGGWVDNVIMRVMDVMLAFPSLILAIAVVSLLGPGLTNALLAISVVFIPAYARVARSGVLSVREEDFVMADRALGVHPVRILFHRILPNALAPLIVQATLGIGTAILDAAALSFLGLGAQPPQPEWGRMLSDERNQILSDPYLVFFPGIAIMITVLAFNLLGDGLRDAFDPRLDR